MSTNSAPIYLHDFLGLPEKIVKLAPYCPEWPRIYLAEKKRLATLLAPLSPQLEHIGSTAVAGMMSKPIIDIMVGVTDGGEMLEAEALLRKSDYNAKGESGIPGRLFFTCGSPCVFHLHLVQREGTIWNNHVDFKNKLISDPEAADLYVATKQDLARKFPADRDSYTKGKAALIEQFLNDFQTSRAVIQR